MSSQVASYLWLIFNSIPINYIFVFIFKYQLYIIIYIIIE